MATNKRTESINTRITRLVLLLSAIIILSIVALSFNEYREAQFKGLDNAITTINDALIEMYHPQTQTQSQQQGFDANFSLNKIMYRMWEIKDGKDILTSHPIGSKESIFLHSFGNNTQPKKNNFDVTFDGNSYYASIKRITIDNNDIAMAVMLSSNFAHKEMREFVRFMIITSIILILISGFATKHIVNQSLRPIDVIAKDLRHVSYSNINLNMPAKTSIPKELKLFVTSFEKMLMRIREASENEKQFISNASHELRTPLTLLKSTLQIATVEKRTAEEYESYIQESLEDVDRMADLIEQLLLLAKLGNEEYQMPTETIEICQLLRGVIDSFNNRLQDSSEILFMSSVEACDIQASLQELGRLFSNVIENAIKYGPKGEDITVTVDTDENFVRITINDKGGNIPQENLGKIFDRFYRLDSNRSRNTGGTGLGLAIAKEIAIRNNGKIEAKSTNTEGTDIIIYLPQKK